MINITIIILTCIGLVLSAYAYNLEYNIKKNATDPNSTYKPLCDLSEQISCSKPILSPYGSVFGISNALVGILLYTAILLFALMGMKTMVFILSLLACCMSVVFAFILFTKIKVVCLVCISIYIVNILLLWASWPTITP